MKIYRSLQEFKKLEKAYVSIGTFDGVHLGHRKILSKLVSDAEFHNAESLLISFFPHPRQVLFPDDLSLKLIDTLSEKIELLEHIGVGHFLIIPFTKEFSELKYTQFVKNILVDTIGSKKILIGYDHHFGKNREGGFEQLKALSKEYDFELEEISKQEIDDMAVSSTKIRKALLNGEIILANQLLGRDFSLKGKVIRGDGKGKTFGYPTANIFVEENYKLIPKDGIYAVKVQCSGERQNGILYIGHRPTIGGMQKNIEVHIFNFSNDIYNAIVQIEFIEFIRDDFHFNTIEEMKVQMDKDSEIAKNILLGNMDTGY